MPKRAAIALVVVFVVTRAFSAWLAYDPDTYKGDTEVSGDAGVYAFYAHELLDNDKTPYSEVKIEYPPGSLVLIALPGALSTDPDTFRLLFIIEMIVVDVLGAVALWFLGRRWKSQYGLWAWVFLIPFLGPIAHVRLDLVPAVFTIWAFERAAAKRWLESGAAIGVGTAVKLYPIALLPILLIVAYRRRQMLLGAVLPLIAMLLPYLGSLSELTDSVLGYQTGRGIQVESTWGILLLVASNLGYGVSTIYNFGAFHVISGISRFLDTLATIVSAAVAIATYWWTYRYAKRGDVRTAAVASLALLSLLLAVSAVWSPQFLVWLIALAAVALCARGERLRYTAYVLAGAGIASQIAYPFVYNDLLNGDAVVSVMLLARNSVVGAMGVLVLFEAFPQLDRWRRGTQTGEISASSAGSGERSTESESPTIL